MDLHFYQKGQRDMIRAKRKKENARREELRVLRKQLDQTQGAIDCALINFQQALDPAMVDCYIYEWNAAQLRYQFLLKCIKGYETDNCSTTFR